ncbi:MAG: FAD-binding oxidoreductase [Syntrophorhabdales bacterium]|jgi:glycolate oxidase
MSLEKEVYRAFEDVVGPENISEDPAILDAYAWVGKSAGAKRPVMPGDEKKDVATFVFAPRFQAVILPKDTLEVQAIVKTCNRRGVKVRAFSTGWVGGNVPGSSHVVLLDLRRMNRILEINEKNMYAVVEPYVIAAQLQAELMKKGLNCNVNGGGAHTSALPLAAFWGTGHMGQSTSNGERNLLAVEWVTPEGEIVRLGSSGSSNEWFCGDGPGPSLRGIIRGATTPLGGMGVYTKAATKVYHWPGPPVFPVEGVSPHYGPGAMPPCFMIRYFSFPSFEKLDEAQCKIGESRIAFELMGFPMSMIAANMATSNEEEISTFERLRTQVQGPGFIVIIAGNSQGDFEYKKRVLERITRETDGKSLEIMEDPKIGGAQLWRFIRISASVRETMRAAGGHFGIFPGHSQFLSITRFTRKVAEMKGELQRKGLLVDDGADAFPWTEEHGYIAHAEVLFRFAPSHESIVGIQGLRKDSVELALHEPVGVPFFATGDQLHDVFGPVSSNYHLWLRKIKKAFDPSGTADSAGYITARD